MANTPVTPAVSPRPVVKAGEAALQGAPFDGVTAQDTTVYTGRWIPVRAGGALEAKVSVTSLVGTLFVHVETCTTPGSDPPRVLGAFPAPAAASPAVWGSAPLPTTFPPCDAYIRFVGTPGQGGGQAATWTVSGRVIVPLASQGP